LLRVKTAGVGELRYEMGLEKTENKVAVAKQETVGSKTTSSGISREKAFRKLWLWGPIALIAIVCALVYSNTLHNGYHLDDFHVVQNNTAIRQIQPIWRHFVDPTTMSVFLSHTDYRPLLPLSLSITYALYGSNVVGYHIFNIAFHMLATVFLYLLFIQLLTFREKDSGSHDSRLPVKGIAFFGAMIFCVHPISGFSVNYIGGRDNIMMLCFLTISLYTYVRMRKVGESPLRWTTSLFFLLLALFSKPNALMAPAIVLAFELIVARSRVTSIKTWFRVGVFAIVVVAHYALRGHVLLSLPNVGGQATALPLPVSPLAIIKTDIPGLMLQLKAHLFYYLRNFVWPFPIRAHPFLTPVKSFLDLKMLLGFATIVGSLIVGWFSRKKSPVISFCIFAYWIMFYVTKDIPYPADRWMYSSLPYLSFVAAYLIFKHTARRASLVITTGLIFYFGISCFAMNRI